MSYPANLTRAEIDAIRAKAIKDGMAVIALIKAAEKVLSK